MCPFILEAEKDGRIDTEEREIKSRTNGLSGGGGVAGLGWVGFSLAAVVKVNPDAYTEKRFTSDVKEFA